MFARPFAWDFGTEFAPIPASYPQKLDYPPANSYLGTVKRFLANLCVLLLLAVPVPPVLAADTDCDMSSMQTGAMSPAVVDRDAMHHDVMDHSMHKGMADMPEASCDCCDEDGCVTDCATAPTAMKSPSQVTTSNETPGDDLSPSYHNAMISPSVPDGVYRPPIRS